MADPETFLLGTDLPRNAVSMGIVSAPSVERITRPSARHWSTFVSFGAGLSVSVGLLSLAGWVFDISVLKSGWPGLVQIKPNTAICLILLGVSLWLRKVETQQARGRILAAQLLAGLVAAIGLASFGEYLFGWDLGIDQLLFAESPNEAARSVRPGLMAPVNAVNFLLLGSALIFLDWTTRRRFWREASRSIRVHSDHRILLVQNGVSPSICCV